MPAFAGMSGRLVVSAISEAYVPTALALSPHLDDAAFSCGGTLATLARAGWRVVIATVFTATVPDPQGFALACQLDKGFGADVDYMALRRNEDFLAARILGAEPVWLPFREAPHRGYESAPALFAGLRPDDRIGAELASGFAPLMLDLRPDLILAPQAIGGHADHIQVFRALSSLQPECPVLWWHDFPYTVRDAAPREPHRAEMSLLPGEEFTIRPDALDAKRAAGLCYTSQLGFQFGGPGGLDQRLAAAGPVEVFRRSGEVPIAEAASALSSEARTPAVPQES